MDGGALSAEASMEMALSYLTCWQNEALLHLRDWARLVYPGG